MTDVNKTEIAVILDRSGSMESIKDDMEGGFKRFVADQKALPGQCVLSLYQFDNEFQTVYEERPLSGVPDLLIVPRGGTALLDAVGRSIALLGERLARKPDHERPAAVVVMVITDGHENASREVSREVLKLAIARQEKQYNWRFIYLGADASALSEAASIGIRAVAKYAPTATGVNQLYVASSQSVGAYRSQVARGDAGADIEIARDLAAPPSSRSS